MYTNCIQILSRGLQDDEEDEDEDEDDGVGRKGSAPARTPDRQSATWLARTDLRQFPLDVLEP